MVLGVGLSFVRRQDWHTKTCGQRCLLDLELKGELIVEGVASELLVANLSSHFLSSLISSGMGENVGTSFFFDDVDVLLAYR